MSSDAQDVPERLGRYEILERLASGGMGEVFLGRFVGPGGFIKPVAVKRIHPFLAEDETFINMLHDEANVAAAIRHPNIVATIDVGFEAGNHFVVLDYVSGDSLSRLLRDQKKRGLAFPDWLVAWIGAETASALHAAHEARSLTGESLEIIHRDVSPANVILSDAGHPMLFDFGVAKATQRLTQTNHGELKGKLPYMAPETFRGATVDRTFDIFGLGVTLYELATNVSPFIRGSDVETIAALQGATIDPPSQVKPDTIRSSLDSIIMRAMARERSERYETAAMIEQDLRAWARSCGAPHDAASAAVWLLENFSERTTKRNALLASVASAPSGTFDRFAQPNSTRSVSRATPFPGYDKTQALAGPTSSPLGQTPVPFSVTAPSRGQTLLSEGTVAPINDKTQAHIDEANVPQGQTSPSSSAPPSDPQATTDASIPGVANVDTQASHIPPLAPRKAPQASSLVHVMLGVATTIAIGAIVVLMVVLSRDKPEDTPAALAAPVPVPTPSAQPIAAPTTPPSAAPEPSATAAASATATTPAPKAAPRVTSTPHSSTPSKRGGPLVRSYD